MIPDLINKLYETGLISKKHFDSLSPLKKDYDKKLGMFLVDGGFLTKKDFTNFSKKNQDFLFELFDKWLNENSKLANAIIWRVKESKKIQTVCHPHIMYGLKIRRGSIGNFWNTLMDILPGLNDAPQLS